MTAHNGRIDVIVGLDFGTRFTKVCYRVLDGSPSKVVIFEKMGSKSALIESIVWVDAWRGFVTATAPRGAGDKRVVPLRYLKMLLREEESFGSSLAQEFRDDWIDLGGLKALAAFFLCQTLKKSIAAIREDEVRFRGQQIHWSVNISIPAQYSNDGFTPRFREVIAVALYWATLPIGDFLTPTVPALCMRYTADVSVATATAAVEVVPEIVAALHHFIKRRQTKIGIHGFWDIGAGTIDACVFRLTRDRSEPIVKILSAEVRPLGTASLAYQAVDGGLLAEIRRIEALLVAKSMPPAEVIHALNGYVRDLENFFAKLLVTARNKLAGRMLVHEPEDAFPTGETNQLNERFIVQTTGGGAQSGWYASSVDAIYDSRSLRRAGIMRWGLSLMEPPPDFDCKDLGFERFVIAWGLTAEPDDLKSLEVRLPKDVDEGIIHKHTSSSKMIYEDTRDAIT